MIVPQRPDRPVAEGGVALRPSRLRVELGRLSEDNGSEALRPSPYGVRSQVRGTPSVLVRSCVVSPCGRGRVLSPPSAWSEKSRMRELAPNLWQLGGFPPHAINVYLIGDVLIDAATRWGGGRVLRELGG